jgi:hypothetical protein
MEVARPAASLLSAPAAGEDWCGQQTGPMFSLRSGLRLHDRFVLVEPVGVGGMSQVWRAVDEVLDRSVAVKVLASPLAGDPTLRQATWREARAAARLAHPHVIQVYDYGEASLPDGALVPYLVMELVDGQSLATRLGEGPLPWREAVRTGAQVAGALAAAHRLGVVHRDVKPGNVMLTPAGAKVLDFGIAALVGRRSEDGGLLVGTPAYAAPEQLHPSSPQPASDVYALGVLLYESLTGRRPVTAASWAEAAAAHRAGAVVPPLAVPDLPPEVARLIIACLAAEPADRPTARSVAAELAVAVGMSDPGAVVDQGTMALPMVAGGAVPLAGNRGGLGSARPPSAPTMIERDWAASTGHGDAPPRRRSRRLVLVGLIGTVAAAGLAWAVVAATVNSGNPVGTAQATPSYATTSAESPTPTGAPPPAAGSSSDAILAELDRVIADAAATGALRGDAAEKLRDKVNELRAPGGKGKGKQRKQAEELRKRIDSLQNEIDQLRDDGEIDNNTADQLTTLAQSLSSAPGGDGG